MAQLSVKKMKKEKKRQSLETAAAVSSEESGKHTKIKDVVKKYISTCLLRKAAKKRFFS